jgi:hypothetical protein
MSNFIIGKNNNLYRRIPKENPNCWKMSNGGKIPSSVNFKTNKGEDGLSIDIDEMTTPKHILSLHPKSVVAEFSASVPINEGYKCLHKPSSKNMAHAIIKGNTKPIAKKLSRSVSKVYDH